MAYSCQCPAGPGNPCPLTALDCAERRDRAKAAARAHQTAALSRRKNDHARHLKLLRETGRTYAA